MIDKCLLISILVFGSADLVAAETYRWEDAEGNVHYSDQLPPAGARNIERTGTGGAGPTQDLPYQLQVAVRKSPVTLYVTDCGDPCNMARTFLVKRGIPHTLLDAMKPDIQTALKALTGGQIEVPVAQVGKTVLRGFESGQWNTALDAAGYPGYAMIKVTPTVPQEAAAAPSAAESEGEISKDDTSDADSDDTDTADEETAIDQEIESEDEQ